MIGYFDGSSYNNIDDAVRACVDSLPNSNNITYFRTILKNSLYKAIIQKYVNSDFAFAVVFSYVSKTIQCYRKIDGRWENTESLITNSDLLHGTVECNYTTVNAEQTFTFSMKKNLSWASGSLYGSVSSDAFTYYAKYQASGSNLLVKVKSSVAQIYKFNYICG